MYNLKLYKNNINKFENLSNNIDSLLIIHYSCESFFDTNGKTPRITSIAIKDFYSGQVSQFSIHKEAELSGCFENIANNYDKLEKNMLNKYFTYLSKMSHKTYIHWNMRSSNYGFKAIEHRYSVLKGKNIFTISEEKTFDLAKYLSDKYGSNYIGNPKMETLMRFNKIIQKDFLSGKEEADAFNNGDYVKLSMSTASKVELFSHIFNLELSGKLKTENNKYKLFGTKRIYILDFLINTIRGKIITHIVSIILGSIIGYYATLILNSISPQ